MFELQIPWWEIVVRTFVVYAFVYLLLRLGGKRELGQMTPFDLVVILVMANAVQNSMNGGDVSLVGGLIAAATLVAANAAVGRFGTRIPFIGRGLVSEPTLLLHDGKVIPKALEREGVTEDEVAMAAREHGIADIRDLSAAFLEPDGAISVIERKGEGLRRSARRVPQLKKG